MRRRGGNSNALNPAAALLLTAIWACGSDPAATPETDAAAESFVFPAEFEPHRSLWMAWPTYENKRGLPTEPLLIEIIRAAEGRVAIDLLAQDDDEAGAIRERFPAARGFPTAT